MYVGPTEERGYVAGTIRKGCCRDSMPKYLLNLLLYLRLSPPFLLLSQFLFLRLPPTLFFYHTSLCPPISLSLSLSLALSLSLSLTLSLSSFIAVPPPLTFIRLYKVHVWPCDSLLGPYVLLVLKYFI